MSDQHFTRPPTFQNTPTHTIHIRLLSDNRLISLLERTVRTVQCSTVQYSVNEHPNTRWYAYEMQDEMGWCEVRLGKVRLGKVEESESSHYILQKKKIQEHIKQIQKKYDERSKRKKENSKEEKKEKRKEEKEKVKEKVEEKE